MAFSGLPRRAPEVLSSSPEWSDPTNNFYLELHKKHDRSSSGQDDRFNSNYITDTDLVNVLIVKSEHVQWNMETQLDSEVLIP